MQAQTPTAGDTFWGQLGFGAATTATQAGILLIFLWNCCTELHHVDSETKGRNLPITLKKRNLQTAAQTDGTLQGHEVSHSHTKGPADTDLLSPSLHTTPPSSGLPPQTCQPRNSLDPQLQKGTMTNPARRKPLGFY